jgi:hypothetical protein
MTALLSSSSSSFVVGRRAAPTTTRRGSRTTAQMCVVASSSSSSSSTPRNRGRKVAPSTSTSAMSSAISTPLASEPSTTGGAPLGPVPTLRELRAAIPKECFEPDVAESLKYAAYDLAALAACFGLLSPVVAGSGDGLQNTRKGVIILEGASLNFLVFFLLGHPSATIQTHT